MFEACHIDGGEETQGRHGNESFKELGRPRSDRGRPRER